MSTYASVQQQPRRQVGARRAERGEVSSRSPRRSSSQTTGAPTVPQKPKKKAGKGKKDFWGAPLGQGQAFDHDPNTMNSYYNPPPQYDFSGDGAPGNFDDPFNAAMSMIPVMQRETVRAIGDATAQAGFTGNRYSSDAMKAVADIGAASAERQNAMLNQSFWDAANQSQDRQMRAAEGYLAAAPQVEDAMSRRLALNQQLASQAQSARQRAQAGADANRRFALDMQYRDFEKNKWGTLPMLMKALSNDLGQTPEPILSTTGGKTGARDTAMDIARIMALMSE